MKKRFIIIFCLILLLCCSIVLFVLTIPNCTIDIMREKIWIPSIYQCLLFDLDISQERPSYAHRDLTWKCLAGYEENSVWHACTISHTWATTQPTANEKQYPIVLYENESYIMQEICWMNCEYTYYILLQKNDERVVFNSMDDIHLTWNDFSRKADAELQTYNTSDSSNSYTEYNTIENITRELGDIVLSDFDKFPFATLSFRLFVGESKDLGKSTINLLTKEILTEE